MKSAPVSYTHLDVYKRQVDIVATVEGGGVSGQAGALRHGISRALLLVNPEYRAILACVTLVAANNNATAIFNICFINL